MSKTLQIRDQTIPSEKIITLLANYQMMPQFLRQVIIDQAIANVTCTPQQQQHACQQFYQKHQLTSEAERQELQTLYGMSAEDLETLAMREQKIELFKQTTWGHKLESYFLQRKASVDQVIYSLIQTPEVELANELYFRLQNAEQSFAELARAYSQGAEAHLGGLVGPVELGKLEPALRQVLMVSYPGQLWMPLRVGTQVAIVRLEQHLPAQLDSTMRQRLLTELFERWLQRQLNELVEGGAVELN
jgi:parvulin-like peptidyl-prolyl isomerase